MTASILNKIFGLFILLIVLFAIFYPDYYKENLQKEILVEKESEMLEWLEMFTLKLDEQNIISGVKEKSDQEIKNEKEMLKAKELKVRTKKIGGIKRIINLVNKTRFKDNDDIKNQINQLKKAINEIETKPFPDVYKYSNVEQIINYIAYSPYDISFWKINNIDLSHFKKMPAKDAEAYLLQNAVFIKIVDRNIEDKNSFSIKPGDEGQKLLANAFLTDGRKILPPQNWQYGSLQLMKLLNPEKAQICLLTQEANLGDYHNNISDFYSFFRGLMAFIILLSPFFYIILEHVVKDKSSSTVDLNLSNKKLSPSVWKIIRGDELSSRIIYLVPMLSPVLIIFAASDVSIEGIGYFLPVTILIYAAGTLPILKKNHEGETAF